MARALTRTRGPISKPPSSGVRRPILVAGILVAGLVAIGLLGCASGGGRPRTDGGLEPGADAGPPAPGCDAPRLTCGDECVDPATDRRHCGGCGTPCAGACAAGVCEAADCRTSELGCPAGTSCDPARGECVTVECAAGLVPCGAECCAPTGFGAPELVGAVGRSLSLALDGADEPVIAFVSLDAGSSSLVMRERSAGAWRDTTLASATDALEASLVVDGNGRTHVAWTGGAMGFSYAVDGGAAQAFGDAPVESIQLRVTSGGRAMVGYGVAGAVRLAERAGVWISEAVAERAVATDVHVAFALSSDRPSFAFARPVGDVYDLRFAADDGAGGWTDEAVDDAGTRGAGSAVGAALAITPAGDPHVVYWVEAGAEAQLWHATRVGGAWERARVASSTGASRDVAIAADAAGVHLAFYDGARVAHGLSRGRGFAITTVRAERAVTEVELALDAGGAPHILYSDGEDVLYLASSR